MNARMPLIGRRVSLFALSFAAVGCQFVQLTDAGATVAQAGAGDVANCTKVGEVDAQTQSKVVLSRGDEKVRAELAILARNRAAELGANAIVPIGPHQEGKQRFNAYLCTDE